MQLLSQLLLPFLYLSLPAILVLATDESSISFNVAEEVGVKEASKPQANTHQYHPHHPQQQPPRPPQVNSQQTHHRLHNSYCPTHFNYYRDQQQPSYTPDYCPPQATTHQHHQQQPYYYYCPSQVNTHFPRHQNTHQYQQQPPRPPHPYTFVREPHATRLPVDHQQKELEHGIDVKAMPHFLSMRTKTSGNCYPIRRANVAKNALTTAPSQATPKDVEQPQSPETILPCQFKSIDHQLQVSQVQAPQNYRYSTPTSSPHSHATPLPHSTHPQTQRQNVRLIKPIPLKFHVNTQQYLHHHPPQQPLRPLQVYNHHTHQHHYFNYYRGHHQPSYTPDYCPPQANTHQHHQQQPYNYYYPSQANTRIPRHQNTHQYQQQPPRQPHATSMAVPQYWGPVDPHFYVHPVMEESSMQRAKQGRQKKNEPKEREHADAHDDVQAQYYQSRSTNSDADH